MRTLFVIALTFAGMASGQRSRSEIAGISEKQARHVVSGFRKSGQVGKSFDLRITNTDRSYNYKLRATWVTSEVLKAAAKLLSSAQGLPEDRVHGLLAQFFTSRTYVLVEIDPREGSGVIPRGWTSHFGSPGDAEPQVQGTVVDTPEMREFLTAFPRDYAYDIFLVEFPVDLENWVGANREFELTVRIYDKVGRVGWKY